MLYEDSITEELVQDWIEELKEVDILDENGNLCRILILLALNLAIMIAIPGFIEE